MSDPYRKGEPVILEKFHAWRPTGREALLFLAFLGAAAIVISIVVFTWRSALTIQPEQCYVELYVRGGADAWQVRGLTPWSIDPLIIEFDNTDDPVAARQKAIDFAKNNCTIIQ